MPSQTMRRGCAVLTAALAATAVLAACSASRPAPAAGGSGTAAGSGSRPGVPGITGPPAIKVNPYAGTVGYSVRPHESGGHGCRTGESVLSVLGLELPRDPA